MHYASSTYGRDWKVECLQSDWISAAAGSPGGIPLKKYVSVWNYACTCQWHVRLHIQASHISHKGIQNIDNIIALTRPSLSVWETRQVLASQSAQDSIYIDVSTIACCHSSKSVIRAAGIGILSGHQSNKCRDSNCQSNSDSHGWERHERTMISWFFVKFDKREK